MNNIASDIKKLQADANSLLLNWLENPPTERRQKQAMELLAEAVQMLNAAAINLGAVDVPDPK